MNSRTVWLCLASSSHLLNSFNCLTLSLLQWSLSFLIAPSLRRLFLSSILCSSVLATLTSAEASSIHPMMPSEFLEFSSIFLKISFIMRRVARFWLISFCSSVVLLNNCLVEQLDEPYYDIEVNRWLCSYDKSPIDW